MRKVIDKLQVAMLFKTLFKTWLTEERVAEFRSLMTGLVDGIEAEMRSDEGETIRDMSIAKRINNYCASLFDNYRNLN